LAQVQDRVFLSVAGLYRSLLLAFRIQIFSHNYLTRVLFWTSIIHFRKMIYAFLYCYFWQSQRLYSWFRWLRYFDLWCSTLKVLVDSVLVRQARFQSTLEIETLQRRYAIATDLLGHSESGSVAHGSAIYHSIFTPDVTMTLVRLDGEIKQFSGIDAWAGLVEITLGQYISTQHLIGTQVVDFESLVVDESGLVTAGDGLLKSYLQGWHTFPDGRIWLVVGIYHAKVRYTNAAGWQIWHMKLEHVANETRPASSS
jgi:hypothetical protein